MGALHWPLFSKRNIIIVFSVAVVAFVILGVLYYNHQKAILNDSIYKELSGVAKIKITDLEGWLYDRKQDAEFIFQNEDFINHLKSYVIARRKKSNLKALNYWFNILNGHREYRNFIIIDLGGRVIYKYRDPSIPLYKSTIAEARKALTENKIVLSDLKLDSLTKNIYMQTYVPIIQKQNDKTNVLGIVIFRIDPFDSFYPLIQSWPLPTRSAESYLIKVEGDSVLYLSNLKDVKDAAMRFKLPLSLHDLSAYNAVRGNEGIFEGKDYMHVPVLADLQKISGTNWFLITEIDRSEVYSPIYKEARLIVFITAFLIIVSAVILFLIWKMQKQKFDLVHYNVLLERAKLREQLNIIIQNANDIFLLLDEARNIVDVNEAAIKTYGFTREEFLKIKADDLSAPNYKTLLSETLANLGEKKKILYETYNIRKNGEIFPVEIGLTLASFETKKVIQLIIRDITERKRSERELLAAKEKAEELNRLKSAFLLNISHELRTPMIGILGFSEMLSKEIKDSQQNYMINNIFTNGKRLLNTLNSVLEFTKMEANREEIRFQKINIHHTVEPIIKSFEQAAKKKNLILNYFISNEKITVKLDMKIFGQILSNLINNAIKFTEKGSVTVQIDLEKNELNQMLVIKVIDTGIGIKQEHLEIIFDDFRQANEGLRRTYEGTGLGLTIAKKSVELLGGTISVESCFGSGSTFIVRVPAEI